MKYRLLILVAFACHKAIAADPQLTHFSKTGDAFVSF